MLARVSSCAVIGLEGVIVDVEVDTGPGLPKISIVGLPDTAVQESRERVASAIKNSNLSFPRNRITVNLAPAAVRKEGPAYDLPIALGILIATKQLPANCLNDALVVGELSLDGKVRHIRGLLSMAVLGRIKGYKSMFVPAIDAPEAALIPNIEVYPVSSLKDLVLYLTKKKKILPHPRIHPQNPKIVKSTDFQEIKGQEHAKRALEVAISGGHNVLMYGPPGAGKTLLARAIPSILPEMTVEEALEVTCIYSVADKLSFGIPLIQTRPFRSPHHTISHAGLVGGGNWPSPGEISLAHRGVLFLDEFPEFNRHVLEVMRQPMEDKRVTISRANGSLTFPSNFQLIAAMNPCPCGYFGDTIKECTCSNVTISRYQKRISGPLLDRIDIHIEVPRVEYGKLSDNRFGEPSNSIQLRVDSAWLRQRERFSKMQLSNPVIGRDGEIVKGNLCNADMGPGQIRKYCQLDTASSELMRRAMIQMKLSARAYHRVLKLARTIADLADEENIAINHLAEALQYRPKLNLM